LFGVMIAPGLVGADTISIVSDTSVNVCGPIDHYATIDSSDWGTSNSAVVTWKHPNWPIISGANWISTAYYTENTRQSSWRMFSDTIEIPACSTEISGSIEKITADNAEEIYLNGILVGSDGEVQGTSIDNQEWNTIKTWEITDYLQEGTNELKIIVRNYAYNTDSPTVNPTGLIYKVTVNYTPDNDCDNDGVPNTEDFCPNTPTEAEIFTEPYGVHRWYWNGENWMQQPNKAGKVNHKTFLIEDTYGCNCHQILDILKEAGLGEFGGHYKFGCSTSILEDFNKDLNDGEIDGKYFIETVTVPANKSTNTLSTNPLALGVNYTLKARGTASAGDNIQFDARYSFRTGTSITWTDAVSTYEGYGVTLLDLLVNGLTPWGDYNASHEYETVIPGTGVNATFRIYDIYYPNNSGNLYVDIYANL